MIVLWGANIASQPNTARHIISARRRGAKVMTIDVRRTEAAAQSDEVLLIRPGSDAALALAIMCYWCHTFEPGGLKPSIRCRRGTMGSRLSDTKVGTFTQAPYDEAQNKGWTVISMRDDWNRILAFAGAGHGLCNRGDGSELESYRLPQTAALYRRLRPLGKGRYELGLLNKDRVMLHRPRYT